jgi:heme exporter protein D
MKTVASLFLVRSAACLLLASPAMAEQAAMRDVATHDQLSEKLRVANNKNPLSELKAAEGEDPTKAKPKDFLSRSDFMSFGGNATLVPKRAILHTPAAMSARIKLQPGSKIQTWADFFAVNRGWITTVEVSRAQAEGKLPLAEEVVKRIEKSTTVVVATYQGGPISVLAPKAPEPAKVPAAAPATVQTVNSKKP